MNPSSSHSDFIRVLLLRLWRELPNAYPKFRAFLMIVSLFWAVLGVFALCLFFIHLPLIPILRFFVFFILGENALTFLVLFLGMLISSLFDFKKPTFFDHFQHVFSFNSKNSWKEIILTSTFIGTISSFVFYFLTMVFVIFIKKILAFPTLFKQWKEQALIKNEVFLNQNPKDAQRFLSQKIPKATHLKTAKHL